MLKKKKNFNIVQAKQNMGYSPISSLEQIKYEDKLRP